MQLSFSSVSTKDLAALCQRAISISEDPAYPVVKDNPLLLAVKTVYNDYDAVYTKKAFSGKSDLLIIADNKRDNPFSGLKSILQGHIKVSSSPYQQDAKDIYAIIEHFGIGLDRYKWAEETAQMKKLLEALALPENMVKIERMLLTVVVTQIRDAQTAFELLYKETSGENAELHAMESASSMRKTLETALHNYLNVVKAMSEIPGWKLLYGQLDEVLKTANNSKPSAPKQVPPTTPVTE